MNSSPTPITVLTAPAEETGSPTKTSPLTPRPADTLIPYRIEEHRRTIYLTSSLPPGKWDTKALGELLSLAEIPDDGSLSDSQMLKHRRVKSMNENDLGVLTDSSNHKYKDASPTSPRTFRFGNNFGFPKSGGSSSTTTT